MEWIPVALKSDGRERKATLNTQTTSVSVLLFITRVFQAGLELCRKREHTVVLLSSLSSTCHGRSELRCKLHIYFISHVMEVQREASSRLVLSRLGIGALCATQLSLLTSSSSSPSLSYSLSLRLRGM